MSELTGSPFSFVYRGRILPTDSKKIDILVRRAMNDILDFAERKAGGNAPRRTGNLVRNIATDPVRRTGSIWQGGLVVRKTAPYAKWVESGTGMFGPYHTPIVPKTGNFLRWKEERTVIGPRGGKKKEVTFVYRHSVKGQRGQRFMERAYIETNRTYVPGRLKVLQSEIAQEILK